MRDRVRVTIGELQRERDAGFDGGGAGERPIPEVSDDGEAAIENVVVTQRLEQFGLALHAVAHVPQIEPYLALELAALGANILALPVDLLTRVVGTQGGA